MEELNRHPDQPKPPTYAATLGNCIRHCEMETTLKTIHPVVEDPNLKKPAPWEPFPATISFTQLPGSKNSTQEVLRTAAMETILAGEQPRGIAY